MKSEDNELIFTKDVNTKSSDELKAGNKKESKVAKTVKDEENLQVFYLIH